jgi:hypothetical protein
MHGLNLPNLTRGNHTVTSGMTPEYNCVSHAIYEDLISLWPDDDNRWPISVECSETIEAFVKLFSQMAFKEVPLIESNAVAGYEKIAIFAVDEVPTHVARQLDNGRWTSKLGTLADIDHADLRCLENGEYGIVVRVMRRINTGRPPVLPPVAPPRPLIIRP